jgi:antibiotic biosynthesis monooxygenase (ABM) superfamily enzyme
MAHAGSTVCTVSSKLAPVSEPSRDRALGRRRLAQMVMTLGAWLVAYVVVLALLTLLGDELESLPLALRALVISGVLVFLMANLAMPVLNVAIARWLSDGQ